MKQRTIHILLIEDSPADVRLLKEALSASKEHHTLHVIMDGQKALDFLGKLGNQLPNLILLDLNIPLKSGHEVLEVIKHDADLLHIPVIVLTSSVNPQDIRRAYDLHANCYIQKPIDLEDYFRVMRIVKDFWMRLVELPPRKPPPTIGLKNV